MVFMIVFGDILGFVGIKDIIMMFLVSDILKLNLFIRKVLVNVVVVVCGMVEVEIKFVMEKGDKFLIGMFNLGVLMVGVMKVIEYIEEVGYEVIVFYVVGFGGWVME